MDIQFKYLFLDFNFYIKLCWAPKMSTLTRDEHPNKKLDQGRIGRAGFQTFLNISQKWNLKIAQQRVLLGGIPNSTYHEWRHQVESLQDFILSEDILKRISYILGIYKALHILLPDENSANQWIHKKNSASLFNNKTALDKMLSSDSIHLANIKQFLDAQRQI